MTTEKFDEAKEVTVQKIETVTLESLGQEAGEPLWRIEIDGYCADFDFEEAANNFANAINARIARLHAPVAHRELLARGLALYDFAKGMPHRETIKEMADAITAQAAQLEIANRKLADFANHLIAKELGVPTDMDLLRAQLEALTKGIAAVRPAIVRELAHRTEVDDREAIHGLECALTILDLHLPAPAGEPDGQHDWFVPDFLNYECCRNCGIVRRADGKNKPCKGRVTVELRSPVETGWLIELGPSVSATPSWYCGDFDDCWTTDSLKAIRYARKDDAQRVIDSIGWTKAFPSEHQWSDHKPAGEPDGGADGEKR